ncbi:hypothetical protein BU26DRAFT_341348 [Trematosphaeria pertusa]|uniref:C2H2-type domain-containing protein n=1 Tax=Trematosphaeria pertusa TaxID=390896 RepID=A0A6A6IC06_9PLEO|nr:uncharacterized protein BU26DRAFT_341348 [Trematosphaeria pertusa]KAF2247080.1 hypothetical protein BU26DRAFT_341348 [Trematosphaeria pertusa]
MCMSEATSYEGGRPKEGFRISPSMGPSSGFLTPPSPYNLEVRRDSIASSQSSMSSFASSMSNYSLPATPTYVQSPMTEEGFIDVTGYDLSQDMQGHIFHGLPMEPQTKMMPSEEGLPGSWMMVPHAPNLTTNPTIQIQPHGILSTAEDLIHPHLAEPASMDSVMVSTPEPSWGHLPAAVFPDSGSPWDNGFLQPIVPEDSMRAFWAAQIQQPQRLQTPTMIPSDSMLVSENSYVHVDPESMTDTDSFDNAGASMPHSPQEVTFKRENSPPLQHDSDAEHRASSLRRSVYMSAVSPTGGKTIVKKERRPGGSSKKPHTRHGKRSDSTLDDSISDVVTLNGVEIEWNEEKQGIDWRGTRLNKSKKLPCPRCPKNFRRPEHLKRHLDTHDPAKRERFGCVLCIKRFGRNDNHHEHYWTHVRKPGKKDGRNPKWTLQEVEELLTKKKLTDAKLVEKLRQKWKKLCEA